MLLVGCGGLQPAGVTQGPVPQGQMPQAENASRETVLHSFGATGDGAIPESGLTDFKGTLYGTTLGGGEFLPSCRVLTPDGGCGTVYSITLSGTETVLHSFKGGEDGALPEARLIVRNGTLYGTTVDRGESCHHSGCGTVFSITPSAQETVLHGFTGSPDGEGPVAPLHNVNGILYGTTGSGGSHVGVNCSSGCGTVFSITPGGKEKVVYSFGAHGNDGVGPGAGLIDVKGTLYGTTGGGGTYNNGTVFSITPGGKETVLYSLRGGTDGSFPTAGLIDVKGTLYGTTYNGGGCTQYREGCGTVFSITPSGKETVLHSFSGGDGAHPAAALLNVNGTLYGTTYEGGAYGAYNNGTVFSITLSGRETVLHSFAVGQDGNNPQSGLSYVNGTFYGTTSGGGAHGYGTVYSITP
jgi:uncharacterized repeat protein (TIGR03803 family)